jgi:F-type H+-transporting ATPase subunit gamma
MEDIQTLQNKLISTAELKKIISSIRLLAIVHKKIYEKIFFNIIKYRSNIELALQGVLQQIPMERQFSRNEIHIDSTLLLIFGSQQGFCGSFNDKMVNFIQHHLSQENNPKILSVGHRLTLLFQAQKIPIYKYFAIPSSAYHIEILLQDIFNFLRQLKRDTTGLVIYFTNHNIRSTSIPIRRKILPPDEKIYDKFKNKPWPTNNIPYWTSRPEKLVGDLINQYIFTGIYMALLGSLTAEQFSRLLTLQNAEQNIQDQIEEINLKINQQRQNTITTELLGLITGFKVSANV